MVRLQFAKPVNLNKRISKPVGRQRTFRLDLCIDLNITISGPIAIC